MVSNLDIVEILKHYENNGFQNTQKLFHLKHDELQKILLDNNVVIRDKSAAYKHRSDKLKHQYISNIIDTLDPFIIYEYYKTHDISETCRKYQTSNRYIYKIFKDHGLPKLSLSDRCFYRLVERLPKNIFLDALSSDNNLSVIAERFNTSPQKLKKLALYYNIDIPKYRMRPISKTELEELYVIRKWSLSAIREYFHTDNSRIKRLLKEYAIVRSDYIYPSSKESMPNRQFEALLESAGILYEKEFRIYYDDHNRYKNFSYDFKVGNYLIEINPVITHNVTIGARGGSSAIKDIYYHQKKSKVATANKFRCIHIWDWTDKEYIINQIRFNNIPIEVIYEEPRKIIYDMKFKNIVEVENEDTVLIYDDGSSNYS